MMDAISGEFDTGEDEQRTLDIEIDVTFQKKRFTSLHLEEPTAKNIERAEQELNFGRPQDATAYQMRRYQITLVAAVAKVPREVVLELKNSEFMRAYNFLNELLALSQKDGAS